MLGNLQEKTIPIGENSSSLFSQTIETKGLKVVYKGSLFLRPNEDLWKGESVVGQDDPNAGLFLESLTRRLYDPDYHGDSKVLIDLLNDPNIILAIPGQISENPQRELAYVEAIRVYEGNDEMLKELSKKNINIKFLRCGPNGNAKTELEKMVATNSAFFHYLSLNGELSTQPPRRRN
jgi:hypothetical protein